MHYLSKQKNCWGTYRFQLDFVKVKIKTNQIQGHQKTHFQSTEKHDFLVQIFFKNKNLEHFLPRSSETQCSTKSKALIPNISYTQWISSLLPKHWWNIQLFERHIPTTHTCSFLHETYKKKFYSLFKMLTSFCPSPPPEINTRSTCLRSKARAVKRLS